MQNIQDDMYTGDREYLIQLHPSSPSNASKGIGKHIATTAGTKLVLKKGLKRHFNLRKEN